MGEGRKPRKEKRTAARNKMPHTGRKAEREREGGGNCRVLGRGCVVLVFLTHG